jgi:hypothetical protein
VPGLLRGDDDGDMVRTAGGDRCGAAQGDDDDDEEVQWRQLHWQPRTVPRRTLQP